MKSNLLRTMVGLPLLCLALPLAANDWDATWAGDSGPAVPFPLPNIPAPALCFSSAGSGHGSDNWVIRNDSTAWRLSAEGTVLACPP